MCVKKAQTNTLNATSSTSSIASQRGVTLVELIVFMVIIGVALAGVLKTLEIANRGSVDPMLTKQAMGIAESLLSEIEQQAFTYCDPNDGNASTANSAAECASNAQDNGGTLGPVPSTESRYSLVDPFDNVSDYNGFVMPGGGCSGICNAGDATPIANLVGYAATVTVTRAGNTGAFSGLPANAVLRILVEVTGPSNIIVRLVAYKVRYAPKI